MHYVFIVGSYYPSFSAVGKCIGNLAEEISHNNTVTVICEQTDLNQLLKSNYNNQRIIRVTTPFRHKVLKATTKYNDCKFLLFCSQQIIRIARMLRRLLSSSSLDKQLVLSFEEALKNIKDVDVIVPACSPFEGVVAATNYNTNYKEIIVCPCLFDLFANNARLNINKINQSIKYRNNLILETEMFEKAYAVFYVDNWKNHIINDFSKYQNKCNNIGHPLLVYSSNGQEKNEMSSIIHSIYLGVVDKKIRNPKKALEILSKIDESSLSFDFYAFGSATKTIERYAKINNLINFKGKVDAKTAELVKNDADVLISLGNSDYSQVPSKIIEYISTGKPIIHFSKDLNDPVIKELDKYPNCLIVDLSSEVEPNAIIHFIKTNYQKRVPIETIQKLFKESDPVYVSSMIIDCVNNHNMSIINN